ncbi:MAG: hypothetical protein KDB69_07240, partial [Acidimicrobiia bacterium]|nr:hypothetical protein [Acidimicrobiia bacterium]
MFIRMPGREGFDIGVDGHRFAPPGASTVEFPDTTGLWALPGLADCHAHVTMNSLAEFDTISDETMATTIPAANWPDVDHGVPLILDKGR